MTVEASPRARAKRAQICDAARPLFLANGYARTTMDAVTAAAGVSKQTLYAYFPGKAELLAEIMVDELGAIDLALPQPQPHSVDGLRQALLGLADRLVGRMMAPEPLALLRLLIGEASFLPELRAVFRQGLPDRLLGAVETLLDQAHRSGLIHAPRPDLSARMFAGPVMSFVALDGLFSAEPPRLPSPETLAFLVDAFLATVEPGRRP